jgi:hypothetical protein
MALRPGTRWYHSCHGAGIGLKRKLAMWTWICCYLTGHDYSVCCVNGAMFLRCVACGRRSQGWVVHAEHGHAHRSPL